MRVVARFHSERHLTEAVRRLKEEGLGAFEVYSPHPVDVAKEGGPKIVPLLTLAAGVAGFLASMALQIYADRVNYVLDIGGRPPNSWPAFIPTAFENGVLCAIVAGFAAFILLAPKGEDPPVEAAMLDECYYLSLSPPDDASLERAHEHFRAAHAEQTIEVPR